MPEPVVQDLKRRSEKRRELWRRLFLGFRHMLASRLGVSREPRFDELLTGTRQRVPVLAFFAFLLRRHNVAAPNVLDDHLASVGTLQLSFVVTGVDVRGCELRNTRDALKVIAKGDSDVSVFFHRFLVLVNIYLFYLLFI